MPCVGTAMFGMFYVLTIFVQEVWGYSALMTGVAYLGSQGKRRQRQALSVALADSTLLSGGNPADR